jgi:hypothetical protein
LGAIHGLHLTGHERTAVRFDDRTRIDLIVFCCKPAAEHAGGSARVPEHAGIDERDPGTGGADFACVGGNMQMGMPAAHE